MKTLALLVPFLLFAFLNLPSAPAEAEVVEDTCRIASPLVAGTNADGDTYYTVFLTCEHVAPLQPPYVVAFVPARPLARLNELVQTKDAVSFKFQNDFPGVILAIEGVEVGTLTPEADRKISLIEVHALGEPTSDLVLRVLDDKNIAKTPQTKTCQSRQLQTYARTSVFTAVHSEFSLAVSEFGPLLTNYGSGCETGPGRTMISIQGRVLKGASFVQGEPLVLDRADSLSLRKFLRPAFSSDKNNSLQIGSVLIQCGNDRCTIKRM